MYFEVAFHSNESALHVASVVTHLVERRIDTAYFIVDGTDAGGAFHKVKLRPLLDQFFILDPDETQVVNAISVDGRAVQLCFPQLELRAVLPAGVLVAPEPLPQ